MDGIARLTFGAESQCVFETLKRRLIFNTERDWGKILNVLKVLEYCLCEGSNGFISWAQKQESTVRSLMSSIEHHVPQDVSSTAIDICTMLGKKEQLFFRGDQVINWTMFETAIEAPEEMEHSADFGLSTNRETRRNPVFVAEDTKLISKDRKTEVHDHTTAVQSHPTVRCHHFSGQDKAIREHGKCSTTPAASLRKKETVSSPKRSGGSPGNTTQNAELKDTPRYDNSVIIGPSSVLSNSDAESLRNYGGMRGNKSASSEQETTNVVSDGHVEPKHQAIRSPSRRTASYPATNIQDPFLCYIQSPFDPIDQDRSVPTDLNGIDFTGLNPFDPTDQNRFEPTDLNGFDFIDLNPFVSSEAKQSRLASSSAGSDTECAWSHQIPRDATTEHNPTGNHRTRKLDLYSPLSSYEDLNYFQVEPRPSMDLTTTSNHSSQEQSLANRLKSYFAAEEVARTLYTDMEIRDISKILKHYTPRWRRVPRTYIVLRTIGSLDLLDDCINVGFSDYWFPVTERSLPDFMPPSIRASFANAQSLILTKSMDLERGDRGQHCYFKKGETLPLESKGVLGRGSHGQVDKVLSLISSEEYARKRVLKSAIFRGRKKEHVKQLIAEIEILKRLKHHHVVEFIGSYTDTKYISLIMTPIADGDLTAYMAGITPARYPELRTFFGCLATALEFLHEHNVRHKDIKPGNILISNGKVLFTDFGLSFDYTDAGGSTTIGMADGLTPRYCAPEVAKHEARNTMSDIWCLGIVFLEMMVTLKGQSVQYMDDFFRQHGSQEVYVRLNTKALPDFINRLAALGQLADNQALEWIKPMLLDTQNMRPTASTLVAQITAPIRERGDAGFCGICCVEPEEEDFSDYASD
jgi:hypothetical protein